jgi:hypothetical protein
VFSGCVPTKTQLYNKVAATKATVLPSIRVQNTHELRQKVAEYFEEPESDLEALIPFHDIQDSDPSNEPRFTVISSNSSSECEYCACINKRVFFNIC